MSSIRPASTALRWFRGQCSRLTRNFWRLAGRDSIRSWRMNFLLPRLQESWLREMRQHEIARVARAEGFSMIIMPTHAGRFRQMLLGSTTAKVLNDADCPVLTSTHAETIAPRPMEHREWLCAIGLGPGSEKMLRFARGAAAEARGKFTIVHAVRTGDPDIPVQLDLKEQIKSAERHYAMQRIAELQGMVGSEAPVRIAVGSVKRRCSRRHWSRMPMRFSSGEAPGPALTAACET